MPNFSAQPLRDAAGNLLNPLTGESVRDCAHRLYMVEVKMHTRDARAQARAFAHTLASSNMARQDARLADFYAAVAAALSEG